MKYFFLLVLLSVSAFAQTVNVKIISPVKHANFDLGIGSRVELSFKDTKAPAIFLGRMVDQENKNLEFLFLDEKKTVISMIDPANVEGFRKTRAQAIISPIDQQGSTCTAYAFFHFWNQMHAVGFQGTAELSTIMDSDRKRMQLLELLIDLYYIQHKLNMTTLMKDHGKRFGFTCRNNVFTDSKLAAQFVFNKASEGKPVLIDFNIGGDMVNSSYGIIDFETSARQDPRLWIPRIIGQRMSSGHVIVAAGAFVANGQKKLLVLDSNWTEPRVWDLERYMGSKMAVGEMGFHTCN